MVGLAVIGRSGALSLLAGCAGRGGVWAGQISRRARAPETTRAGAVRGGVVAEVLGRGAGLVVYPGVRR